ncbi:MAG: hypothetical protein QOI24_3906 [Acidobacteriota bacterium]|nr:hypothetical protein [Acidobacteriota bacterium]
MFVLALAQSWARWLEPIIDTGRDLYIPEQLAHGAKLYRDIRYQYPPLAPYLLAAITSAIGHSLASYIAIGIAQSLCAATLIWSIARRSAGTVAAFAACAMFVALNVAGATTWGANWIFPYSYAATIGMVALLGLIAAIRAQRIALAVLAALIASWCKVEYAIAVVIIVVAAALFERLPLRAFIVSALASVAVVALIFRDTAWLSENIFNKSLTEGASAKHFYAHVSGAAGWPHNLGLALLGTIGLVAIALLLRMQNRVIATIGVIAIAACFTGDTFLRAFGVVQWLALAWVFVKDRRSPLALFAIASFAATLRIALNVSHAWYGDVLSAPVYLLIAYLLFEYLPARGVYTRRAAMLWLIPIAFICGRELFEQRAAYAEKRFPIVTKRGTFYDHNPDRAAALNAFLASNPTGTLVVIPEGITLNYLAGLRTPLTFHTFTPVETADPSVESKIIAELTAHPPARIAIVTRDVREFGYRAFGADYDRRLAALIAARYTIERRERGPHFELIVLKSNQGVRSGNLTLASCPAAS